MTESVRVNLRLTPSKVAAVQAAVKSLGIENLTSACNYLLNKGLEQSSSMAANARSAQSSEAMLSLLMAAAQREGKDASILDTSPQVVTGSKSIPDSDSQEGSENEG